MMQNVYVQPAAQPVAVVPTATPKTEPAVKRAKHAPTIYKFGIVELVLGCSCCLLCIICIIITAATGERYYYMYYHLLVYISPGIWCGVFPFISGILGIKIRRNSSSSMYIANMVMSIVSSVFMLILVCFSITTAAVISFYAPILALQILLTFCSFAAFVINIIHAVYCCAGVCCLGHATQGQVLYVANQNAGQQYVQLPNGQYMMVQAQPVTGQVYPVAAVACAQGAQRTTATIPSVMPQYPTQPMAQNPTQPLLAAVDPTKQGYDSQQQQQHYQFSSPGYGEAQPGNPTL